MFQKRACCLNTLAFVFLKRECDHFEDVSIT